MSSLSDEVRSRSAALAECHLFMRLAREWDSRFEKVFRTGGVAKWYSSVGNEAIAVPAASAIEAGDALLTLHRDSGAILRYYLDARDLFPDLDLEPLARKTPRADSRDLLYRLACQVLGKADGFSGGYERSYHYGLIDEDRGFVHIGMISHLGAMIPVAAGAGLAFRRRGSDRVALNFIGDGGTSTGDFHEGLNMAAVLRLPLVLVIENNQYAFSTPAREQYVAKTLASRAEGYGMPGVRVDGTDPELVYREVARAVERARAGAGPSLIEAVVGRLRGHSEGDDSYRRLSDDERRAAEGRDPVATFERRLIAEELATPERLDRVREVCASLVLDVVDRALSAPDPEPGGERAVHAG